MLSAPELDRPTVTTSTPTKNSVRPELLLQTLTINSPRLNQNASEKPEPTSKSLAKKSEQTYKAQHRTYQQLQQQCHGNLYDATDDDICLIDKNPQKKK